MAADVANFAIFQKGDPVRPETHRLLFEMRVLLGREDFLNTAQGGFAHRDKLHRTMDWG